MDEETRVHDVRVRHTLASIYIENGQIGYEINDDLPRSSLCAILGMLRFVEHDVEHLVDESLEPNDGGENDG